MSEFREDHDETVLPFWRRHLGKIAGGGLIALVLLGVFFGGRRPVQENDANARPLGIVTPYAEVVDKPAARIPPPPAAPPTKALLRPLVQNTMAASSAGTFIPATISYPVKVDPPPAAPGGTPAATKTKINFEGGTIPGLKASPAYDLSLMLMPGILPCVLMNAIDSDLAGPVECQVPGDVYSPKGVKLIESGSYIMAHYKTLKGRGGARRLDVDSAYGWTPNGVFFTLAGNPWGDGLGRTGLSGGIDRHYLERFGGAVLLDLGQSALGIIQAKVSQGGNVYLQTGNSSGLAQQILAETINIPDTFTKHQGEMIGIWIVQPVSFADAYRLSERP